MEAEGEAHGGGQAVEVGIALVDAVGVAGAAVVHRFAFGGEIGLTADGGDSFGFRHRRREVAGCFGAEHGAQAALVVFHGVGVGKGRGRVREADGALRAGDAEVGGDVAAAEGEQGAGAVPGGELAVDALEALAVRDEQGARRVGAQQIDERLAAVVGVHQERPGVLGEKGGGAEDGRIGGRGGGDCELGEVDAGLEGLPAGWRRFRKQGARRTWAQARGTSRRKWERGSEV